MQSSTRPRPIGWRVHSRDQRIILLIGDAFVSTIALFGGLYFWGQKDAWLKFSLNFLQQRVDFWFWLLPVIWMVFLVELYDPHRARNLRQTVAGIAIAALTGLLLYALVYLISQKGSLPRLGIGIFLVLASVLTLIWRLVYIRMPYAEALEQDRRLARETAARLDLRYEEIEGTAEWLRRMIAGEWDGDFVVVPPGTPIELKHFLAG